MKKKINLSLPNGFSLIEVLIFVSILSIFFVVATSVTVVSLRNMKINEHKILATYYAEELAEWLRDQKEADWTEFINKSSETYCFKTTPITDDWLTKVSGDCAPSDYLITANGQPTIFLRNAVLDGTNQVNIKITVSWTELGNNYEVPLATVFTRWED